MTPHTRKQKRPPLELFNLRPAPGRRGLATLGQNLIQHGFPLRRGEGFPLYQVVARGQLGQRAFSVRTPPTMSTPSHGLRRELKLVDLVTMQVVLVFGMSWAGFAAKQGPSQLVLWLMAIALFYLPLSGVVMNLSRTLPLEGGVYQWARAGLSPFAGFLSAWCVAVYCVVVFGAIGSGLANGFAWALGPSWGWIGTDRWVAFGLTLAFCIVSWWVNLRGLSMLKWLGDSSAILWGLLAFTLLAGSVVYWRGSRRLSRATPPG